MKLPPALAVVEAWLVSHASGHTRRSYRREVDRLRANLEANETLRVVDAAGLQRYFNDFAAGRVSLPGTRSTMASAPSPASLRHARTVLRQMYAELQQAGLRRDNPIDGTTLPVQHTRGRLRQTQPRLQVKRTYPLKWKPADVGDNVELARAVLIAEMSYWVGIQRSELATAVMADLRVAADDWRLAIRRVGQEQIDEIPVSDSIMVALGHYRRLRGLPGKPRRNETTVPLIASLKGERPVTAGTIAQALAGLPPLPGGAPMGLTARQLRADFVELGVSRHVDHAALVAHVRSKYAIDRLLPVPSQAALRAALRTLQLVVPT